MKKYLVLLVFLFASCSTAVQEQQEGSGYYTASSLDGIFFTMDERPDFVVVFDENLPLHLESGLFRKYEVDSQDKSKIYSYISYDNVVWQKEDGVRLELPNDAVVRNIDVFQQANGIFRMFLDVDVI